MRLVAREFINGDRDTLRFDSIQPIVELSDRSPMTIQRMFVAGLILAGLVISCVVLGWLDRA